jgi:hypothetical protein
MDEIYKSIGEAIRNRATTALVGTYSIFWSIYHWQGIYTSLFVSEDHIFEKFHMLKNEYVNTYFFGLHGFGDSQYYLGILIPLALTFIFIWVLPEFLFIHAFKKERDYKTAKRKIVLKAEADIQKIKTTLANESSKALDAEIVRIEKEQEIKQLNPSKEFELEYEEFKQNSDYQDLEEIIEAVYEHQGNFKEYSNGNILYDPKVSKEALALAHSNGLININNNAETIDLTEKGKFFVSRFLSHK